MSPKREKALIAVALAHLTAVALGACYVDFRKAGGYLGTALDFYGEMSGADHSYGFFAPGVGTQVRARFEVVDASGKHAELSLLDGSSHEADLRVGNIIDQFLHMDDDDGDDAQELRRSLAASLAGTIFGQQPEAKEVTVHLDEFTPTFRAEYLAGKRGAWEERYHARFRHDVTQQTAQNAEGQP